METLALLTTLGSGLIMSLWLLAAVYFGIVAIDIAQSKGYDGMGWFFSGFFFGIFGVLHIGFKAPAHQETR